MEEAGIKNSLQLFNVAKNKRSRDQLARKSKIPNEIMDELICLSDLARITGVGPVFARMIYDVGIKTVEEFVNKTAEEFIRIYEEKEKKKADFGINEIQFGLDHAKELDIAVEL